ncbi:MAG: MoaD/ThiS family protein [Calditrichaeota bacterium]|nr:MAG: MoaD/ThiS family protein [Calditrichota bacterium]
MKIKILFFAIYKEITGTAKLELEVPEKTDGLKLQEILEQKFPDLIKLRGVGKLAVNLDYSPMETVLEDGDEVTFIAPVSGG